MTDRDRARTRCRPAVVVTATVLAAVASIAPAAARPTAGLDPPAGRARGTGDLAPEVAVDLDGPGPAREVLPSGPVALPPDAIGTHQWPVDGAILDPWHASSNPYGPGHRGVDLEVEAGTVVRATADGVVGFAGVVAGQGWASVDHTGGLRTTVGPLAVVAVRAGESVRQGTVLGTAAATAHADARTPRTARLHVSARVHGTYVDPAPLVGRLVATLLSPTTDHGAG